MSDVSKRLVSLQGARWDIWCAFPLRLKVVGRIQASQLMFPEGVGNPFTETRKANGAQQSASCTTLAVSVLQQVTHCVPFLDCL